MGKRSTVGRKCSQKELLSQLEEVWCAAAYLTDSLDYATEELEQAMVDMVRPNLQEWERRTAWGLVAAFHVMTGSAKAMIERLRNLLDSAQHAHG